MGKKKGKKTAGAEEKTEAEIQNSADCIEANGDHAEAPKKNLTKAKKKKKGDNWEDDVADELAQLSLDTPGKDDKTGENEVEFYDPGDDDSSKKKKKQKSKQTERESPEPQKEGDDDQPEFYDPGDDDSSKKKKKQKSKQTERESPEPQKEGDDDQHEFFEPSDDERSKKKKKKKEKQQPTRQSPEPSQDMEKNEPEFFEPSEEEIKKKKKKVERVEEKAEEKDNGEEQETSTVKTKAQKLAEKKEREKKKKERQKQGKAKTKVKTEDAVGNTEEEKQDVGDVPEMEGVDAVDVKEEKTSKKKKKDKKEKKGEADTTSRKKPGNKVIAAMQDALRKQKEEEERLKQEEEEKERKEDEARQERIDKLDEEKMRKERKKQRAKERIIRLKAEGKYLTPTQKEAQRKREAYVESLRQQGLLPVSNKQKPKYDNLSKTMKKNRQSPVDEKAKVHQEKEEEEVVEKEDETAEMIEEAEEAAEDDDVADDWEAVLEDSEDEEAAVGKATPEAEGINEDDKEEEEEEDSDEESEEESSEEESEEEEDDLTPRQRAERRIELRKEKCEQNRSTDDMRSPVICVMGHVDTGKTKILDKIRHSHVQDGEAGGITQQIGATFVPLETIREQTLMVKSFQEFDVTLPGLLVIDTPGHESFSNLRSRGSSVCDMAILVVDIMHGLEPQTVESINMLKKRKTPFVVALNKVDLLYEWKRGPDSDITNTLKKQKRHVKDEFEERIRGIVVEFAQQNLNVKLFHENDDPKEWISMVPTSAHSGDGMGNLIALVMQLCQSMLSKRLAFSEELQSIVLEVKQIPGLGTTIDVILTNGRLKCGDTIVLAGVEGPIVSHIKGLLMPQPLKELRVKNPYNKFENLKAAQGVKILAKDLEKALAGTHLLVAHKDDEIDILKNEIQAEVDKTLKSIKLQERGVFVQASTLGSLEALLEFLKQSKIPYAGIGIGPVHKKDIMKTSVMLEHDSQWAVILAFDVKVERDAQELADSLGVRIFTADIIYHLFDSFMQHREDLKKQKQEEFRNVAVFPCKLRIMPNCVFKSRDPIVVGVTIDAGQLRRHTPICIPSKEFLMVGYVTSMEFNHKQLEIARTGQEVCIKIEGTPGEPPKMVGRHFEETDILVSKISRESINALKNWFRDDMQKSDWQLIIELKKLFEII